MKYTSTVAVVVYLYVVKVDVHSLPQKNTRIFFPS